MPQPPRVFPWSCGLSQTHTTSWQRSADTRATCSFLLSCTTFHIQVYVEDDKLLTCCRLIADILSLLATIGLFTFPGWQEEVDGETGDLIVMKPFPSRRITFILVVLTGFASGLAFAASLWQHTTASAIASLTETVSHGTVGASVGGAAVALVWFPFALSFTVFLGIFVMVISIAMLDRMTDEE